MDTPTLHTNQIPSLVFISLMLMFTAVLVVMATSTSPDGIIPHPEGHSVFLEGEACTVNLEPALSYLEVNNRLMWCAQQYRGRVLRRARDN